MKLLVRLSAIFFMVVVVPSSPVFALDELPKPRVLDEAVVADRQIVSLITDAGVAPKDVANHFRTNLVPIIDRLVKKELGADVSYIQVPPSMRVDYARRAQAVFQFQSKSSNSHRNDSPTKHNGQISPLTDSVIKPKTDTAAESKQPAAKLTPNDDAMLKMLDEVDRKANAEISAREKTPKNAINETTVDSPFADLVPQGYRPGEHHAGPAGAQMVLKPTSTFDARISSFWPLILCIPTGFLAGVILGSALCSALLFLGLFLGRVPLRRFAKFAGIFLIIVLCTYGFISLSMLFENEPSAYSNRSTALAHEPAPMNNSESVWIQPLRAAGFIVGIGLFQSLLRKLFREALPQTSDFDKKGDTR